MIARLNRARYIIALVLLAAWPVMSSHALLQHWGFIHEVHADHDHDGGSHEHKTDHHAFADGDYLRGTNAIQLSKQIILVAIAAMVIGALLALDFSLARLVRPAGPAPPGTSPPELTHSWQFFIRAALLARAPSLNS